MKKDNAITLLKHVSKDAHTKLKRCRNGRIKERLEASKQIELGFRFMGYVIKPHGNIKEKLRPYYTSYAKCYVCNKDISDCSCKIEVYDQNHNLIKTI